LEDLPKKNAATWMILRQINRKYFLQSQNTTITTSAIS
jgi:hypothetical protein